jgi:flagellar basal body P-ring formation protein FlgA
MAQRLKALIMFAAKQWFCGCWLLALSTHGVLAGDQIVLRFHSNPQTSNSVVKLKDIVEIVSGSVPSFDKLRDLSLGPAPRPGQMQTWFSSDVLQHLELRGVHPRSVRWTGAESTKLEGVKSIDAATISSLTPAFIDERVIAAAQNNVAMAIKEFVNLKTGGRTDWHVRVSVDSQYVKMLQSRRNIQSIGGGADPWIGEQEFTLQVKPVGARAATFKVRANIELPASIVVAVAPIRRDQILSADMLTYTPAPKGADSAKYYIDVEQLVGKQVRKSLSTSQPLTEDMLGEPIVIQRNELIEVESVAGSVVVKTSGKSLGSGAIGESIDVELPDRKKLKATVVATGVARISAAPYFAGNR